MKNLVIVESPSKSKTIEKYLGKDYKVMSSKGHIRDLATKGKGGLGVDVENDFKPTYVVSKDKKKLVEELKKAAAASDNVYLATDPDREGEAISWHLAHELGLDLDQKDRIVFNEITKNAVLTALENPRKIDMDLVRSQETRRILDRIIGFKLSKLLQIKIKSKSAGRVQSIALRMICDKEKEIAAFKPEEYWTLEAEFVKNAKKFKAELSKDQGKKVKIKYEESALAYFERTQDPFTVAKVSKTLKKRSPRLPFITSTLQQEASSKLGFGAKKTMMLAQMLYEGIDIGKETVGLITYMRTDSTRLSSVFTSAAHKLIEERYGKEYLGKYRVKNDENSQDAHEAIRPTSLDNTPEKVKEYLTNDQYKLYKFIYERALSSLMADAKNEATTYELETNSLTYTASGSVLVFDGFLKVYKDYDSAKDTILPPLSEGDKLNKTSLVKEQHFTEAPLRYSEARLIKALEEEGVGRPSTYAMIIDTIIKRGYVELKKANDNSKTKFFFPTEQGILTDDKLKEYFLSVINVKYTAEMEKELDEIAIGKEDNIEALKDFYKRFEPLLDAAYNNMEKVEAQKTGEKCPLCGGDLVYRQSRYGKFISCSNYPECKYKASLNDTVKEEPVKIGRTCPECGSELVKRKSRYGNYFIGCSGYPKCHYIENIEGEKRPFKVKRKTK